MFKLQSLIVAVAVALAVGLAAGYYTKGQFDTAKEVKQDRAVIRGTAQGIVESVKKSDAIEQTVQKQGVNASQIQQAIDQRFAKEKQRASQPVHVDTSASGNDATTAQGAETVRYSCPAPVLDVGTVRLLNAARQGESVESVTGSDEALAAPTAIGLEELTRSDQEVTRMYRELAERHDRLVEEVQEHLKQQAE